MDVLIFFVILTALILDILASVKLVKSKTLDEKVIRLNLILTWLIPFIWAIIVLSFSEGPPNKTGKRESHRYMETGYPMS